VALLKGLGSYNLRFREDTGAEKENWLFAEEDYPAKFNEALGILKKKIDAGERMPGLLYVTDASGKTIAQAHISKGAPTTTDTTETKAPGWNPDARTPAAPPLPKSTVRPEIWVALGVGVAAVVGVGLYMSR
jgi:hypothetical protein